VIVTGRQLDGAANVPSFDYMPVDFADKAQLESFATQVEQLEGLSILINNAGLNRIHTFEAFPTQDYEQLHQVNLYAPHRVAQAAARNMLAAGCKGRILNIASIWATHTKPGRSGYSSAKAGLLGMTRAMATDLAHAGILVNALSPGFIDTELTRQTMGQAGIREMQGAVPLGRLGQPEEIAEFASFLVGQGNTYMTGQNIIVDGGFTNV
jgi:3-oxoacyl-[acyl-carrier protein] reductase